MKVVLCDNLNQLLSERKIKKDVEGIRINNIYYVLEFLLYHNNNKENKEDYNNLVKELALCENTYKYYINNIYIDINEDHKKKILYYKKTDHYSIYVDKGIIKNIYLFINKDIIYNPYKEQCKIETSNKTIPDKEYYNYFVDTEKGKYYYIKQNEKIYIEPDDFKSHILYTNFKNKLLYKIFESESELYPLKYFEIEKQKEILYEKQLKELFYKCFFAFKDRKDFNVNELQVRLLLFSDLIEKYNKLVDIDDKNNGFLSPNKSYILLEQDYAWLNSHTIYIYKPDSVQNFNLNDYEEYINFKNK